MEERKDFKIYRIAYFSLIGALGFGLVAMSRILVIKNFSIFLLIAAMVGIVIGYALAKSVMLCFPQLVSLRRCLVFSGTMGGAIYLPLTGSGGVFLYFPGLVLFAIAWGLCGQTLSSKVRITMSVIVADLISTLIPTAVII
ncbi:MAG: hypothetical protein HZA12_07785 [Nitrospirae bacterium]|nr:hypothetical protein [Nitrospirota bacterium]